MNCKTCQTEILPGVKFCPECGAKTAQTCTCGTQLSGNEKFCPECGNPMGSSSPSHRYSGSPSPDPSSHPGYSMGMQHTGAPPQASVPQVELQPGDVVGSYTIHEQLGRGGFGSVYRATEGFLKEDYALKVLPLISRDYIKNILLEFKSRNRIKDFGHIIKAWQPQPAVYQGQDILLYPMELADRSLRQWLNEHKVEPEVIMGQGLALFKQACGGVQAIHEAGLTHLDIKPENILLIRDPKKENDWIVKIADFGLARGMGMETLSALEDGMGTPAYMAPEQIMAARWKDVGKEADIYGLGMILYEMLDGDLPYSGTPAQIKQKKRDAGISISPPEGPEHLAQVAMACLDRDKGKRTASARGILEMLDAGAREAAEAEKRRAKAGELLEQARADYEQEHYEAAMEKLEHALELDKGRKEIKEWISKAGSALKKLREEEERKQKEAEEKRRKAEEEERRKQAERERKQREAEERKQKEAEEKRRKAEEEERRKQAERERKQREAEERKQKEAEEKRRKAEEEEQRQSQLGGEMVFVQGGRFRMGSKDIWNAKPVHEVELDDFYIGKYPVTQAQWKAVMGENPSSFKGDDRPVEEVSWEDAQGFIRKLNSLTGKSFRLPTEAEWEYAARGGQKGRGYTYSGSDNLHDVGWFEDNSGDETHPVGRKKANELGIYDMSGNVYEWCSDWYDDDYYEKSPRRNPQGPATGSLRLYRGGGWFSSPGICRCAHRLYYFPGSRRNIIGFRLVCSSS